MGRKRQEKCSEDLQKRLCDWLDSCRRAKSKAVSRNTVAVGIVVLDHLLEKCPLAREDVVSQGGEIKGARSGLRNLLIRWGVPGTFLKEVTTRQAHQDGQRLLDAFTWGRSLAGTSEEERRALLSELIDKLKNEALVWLRRQNLKLQLERRDGPTKWINVILESARGRSGGIVEQHLVGAKLERRFKTITIPNHPAHAGDRQTEREGDFRISNSVFHVTATPTRDVLRKCASNASAGMHPVLLVPAGEVNRAKLLAEVEGVAASATVISIEDFLTMNIIELAAEESSDFFTILKEILVIYNRRLVEVETDLSLQVEIR